MPANPPLRASASAPAATKAALKPPEVRRPAEAMAGTLTKYVEEKLSNLPADIADLPFIPKRKFNDKDQAQAAAKSQAQALQRSLGEVDMTLAKGDPWICEQQRMLIRQMRDGVNGSYVTDMVANTYVKNTGIITAIKAKPDSNAKDYEELFEQAENDDVFLRQNFLVPGAGGLIGSLLRDGGVGLTAPGNVAGRTAEDFISGLNPFVR